MKFRLVALFVCMIFATTLVNPHVIDVSAATSKTSAEALSWVASKKNTKVGSGQCVALIAAYYNYLGFSSVSGNGCDYATNRIPEGLGWREKGGVPQPGDILIYTGTTYGHVAIHESDNVSWHQNWNGLYVERVARNYRNSYKYQGQTNTYWGCIHVNFAGSTKEEISIYTNPRYRVGNDITITWDYTNDKANNWFVLFNEDGTVYKNYQNQGTNTSITLQNIPEGKYYAFVEWYSLGGDLCNNKSSVFEVISGTEFYIQDEYYCKDVTIRWTNTVENANYWLTIRNEQNVEYARATDLGAISYHTFEELPPGKYYAHLEWYEGSDFFAEDSECFTVTDECISKQIAYFDNSKYILFDTRMSWRAANDYCKSIGGTLVNINSSEENEVIYNLIQNGDREYYWIGCRDDVTEGKWYWTDNTAFWNGGVSGTKIGYRYSNWDSIEPNASSSISDYGCIYRSSGKWDDTYFFFYNIGFVCEINRPKYNVLFDANQGSLNTSMIAQKTVDGVNTVRKTDNLIVYNDSGATTGTNIWGGEVLVDSNNKVISIIRDVGNATIPHNGMVLSGHYSSYDWLVANVTIDDYVFFDQQNNRIEIYRGENWYSKHKTCMNSEQYGYLPTPTRENYIFDGWYTSAIGGTRITADTIVTNSNNHTLYAHWTPVEPYTVTTVNNKTFTIAPKNIDAGSLIILVLYKDNQYVTMYKATYKGENIPFTVTEKYDKAKVLVWNDFRNIKPITNVELVE